MGLLQARENDRIGAGPAGFIQIQTHAWYDGVDWEATLRREVIAPWVPPPSDDGAVDVGIDFAREDVRKPPTTHTHHHHRPVLPSLGCLGSLLFFALARIPSVLTCHMHATIMNAGDAGSPI